MSTTVLPQLRIIEAELADQEIQLTAQLDEIREKLNGIRAVLPMFSASSAFASATIGEEASAGKTKKAAAVGKKPTKTPITAAPKATTVKTAKTKKVTDKKPSVKKADGRAADWQKYTRPGVKNQSMPDAVRLILETQSEKNFTIAEVMDALFKENMPKAQHLKARNRISNVLSGGVRAGDWYKGARGTYRMTA